MVAARQQKSLKLICHLYDLNYDEEWYNGNDGKWRVYDAYWDLPAQNYDASSDLSNSFEALKAAATVSCFA